MRVICAQNIKTVSSFAYLLYVCAEAAQALILSSRTDQYKSVLDDKFKAWAAFGVRFRSVFQRDRKVKKERSSCRAVFYIITAEQYPKNRP